MWEVISEPSPQDDFRKGWCQCSVLYNPSSSGISSHGTEPPERGQHPHLNSTTCGKTHSGRETKPKQTRGPGLLSSHSLRRDLDFVLGGRIYSYKTRALSHPSHPKRTRKKKPPARGDGNRKPGEAGRVTGPGAIRCPASAATACKVQLCLEWFYSEWEMKEKPPLKKCEATRTL